jgi:hypothetical protein
MLLLVLSCLIPACAAVTYYVDSKGGDDGADGTSPETAFATLTRVRPLITDDVTVRLRRGSLFRDHLSLGSFPFSNITVNAYGQGPRPIIDGADLIPAEQWQPAASPDAVGLYETTVHAGNFSPVEMVQVIENGVRLPRLAALSNCVARPGSSFDQPLGSNSFRVYVHPTGSSLEGKTYAVARRDCVRIWGSNHRLDDLHLRNPVTSTGSLGIFEGTNFTASGLYLENGTKHHLVISSGTLSNCVFHNLQWPGGVPSVYSLYRHEIEGAFLEVHDSTFLQDGHLIGQGEITVSHGAAGSVGKPDYILHSNCRAFNLHGLGSFFGRGYLTYSNCLFVNVPVGVQSPRFRFVDSQWLGRVGSPDHYFFLSFGREVDATVRNSVIISDRFFQASLEGNPQCEISDNYILCRSGFKVAPSNAFTRLVFERNLMSADWFFEFYNQPMPSNAVWSINSNQFFGGIDFTRGTPPVNYTLGNYIQMDDQYQSLSQWLETKGWIGNTFGDRTSLATSSPAEAPAPDILPGAEFTLVAAGTTLGPSYRLETSTDLNTWSVAGTNQPGTGRNLYWLFDTRHCGQMFFRLGVAD